MSSHSADQEEHRRFTVVLWLHKKFDWGVIELHILLRTTKVKFSSVCKFRRMFWLTYTANSVIGRELGVLIP